MALMALVTTAKAHPSMPVRASPMDKRGVAGLASASTDAPKGGSAAAHSAGGDIEALHPELDAALDLSCSVPQEHVPKAAANVGLHLCVLALAAGNVPMVVNAKTRA